MTTLICIYGMGRVMCLDCYPFVESNEDASDDDYKGSISDDHDNESELEE